MLKLNFTFYCPDGCQIYKASVYSDNFAEALSDISDNLVCPACGGHNIGITSLSISDDEQTLPIPTHYGPVDMCNMDYYGDMCFSCITGTCPSINCADCSAKTTNTHGLPTCGCLATVNPANIECPYYHKI